MAKEHFPANFCRAHNLTTVAKVFVKFDTVFGRLYAKLMAKPKGYSSTRTVEEREIRLDELPEEIRHWLVDK
ncbi:MAG: hypothetical protein D6732_24820 [Methanobacteriota archaeon]|nr:MAG: hypothetical protein D6732_24820 [Euryarchaeota archaeon]